MSGMQEGDCGGIRGEEMKEKKKRIDSILIEKKNNLLKTWGPVFIILVFILSIMLFPSHKSHSLFQEYLKIIGLWPISIFLLILIFISKYKNSIESIIQNGFRFKTPYVEFSTINQNSPEIQTDRIETQKTSLISHGSETEKIMLLKMVSFERIGRFMYRSQFLLLSFLGQPDSSLSLSICEKKFYKGLYLANGGNKNYLFSLYINWLTDFLAANIT